MSEFSKWTFRLKNEDGSIIANLLEASKRRVRLGLNKAGEASFTYDLEELHDLAETLGYSGVDSLVGLGRHTLECLRNDEVFFAGQMIDMKKELNSDSATVDLKALGFFWLLGKRFVGIDSDLEYTNTDAGSIAWDLIDTVQTDTNGDFGITQGSISTSVNRTIAYTRKSVKDAIEDLAIADNGFDFEVDVNKIFNVYYPERGVDLSANTIFRYPSSHVIDIHEFRDASRLANKIHAIGSGFGLEEVYVERDNTQSQSTFSVRERIIPIKDMPNATVLGDIADEAVNVLGNVIPSYRVRFINSDDFSPNLSSFGIGDTIGLLISKNYFNIDQSFRVFEIDVRVAENDLETVDLTIGLI